MARPDTTPPTAPSRSGRRHPQTRALDLLSWAAATDNVGVTGYSVYRGTAAGSDRRPDGVGNVTTYTDATAVTGTRYYYAVSAIDAAGNEGVKTPEATVDRSRQPQDRFPTRRSAPPAAPATLALAWSAKRSLTVAGVINL